LPDVVRHRPRTIVVQGWKVTDTQTLSQMDIPEHETVLEVPAALFQHLPPGQAV
jgi:hypothetical protein